MKAETEDERMEQISVLVADDDREIVESIAIFLKAENYDVIKAYNGREALEKARENSVQLIILDIMMPEMDGIRTLLKLREEKKSAGYSAFCQIGGQRQNFRTYRRRGRLRDQTV